MARDTITAYETGGTPGVQEPILSKGTGPLYETDEATGGDDLVLSWPFDPTIADDSLIGKYVYSYYHDAFVEIEGNAADGETSIEITLAEMLDMTGDAAGTVLDIYSTSDFISVSKAGDDEDSGTPSAPMLTIQAAIDAAVVGEVSRVLVMDSGSYEEELDQQGIVLEAKAGQSPLLIPVVAGNRVEFSAVDVTDGAKVLAGVDGRLLLVYKADANKALTPKIVAALKTGPWVKDLVLPKSEDGAVIVAGPFETEVYEQADGFINIDYTAGDVGGILAIRIK